MADINYGNNQISIPENKQHDSSYYDSCISAYTNEINKYKKFNIEHDGHISECKQRLQELNPSDENYDIKSADITNTILSYEHKIEINNDVIARYQDLINDYKNAKNQYCSSQPQSEETNTDETPKDENTENSEFNDKAEQTKTDDNLVDGGTDKTKTEKAEKEEDKLAPGPYKASLVEKSENQKAFASINTVGKEQTPTASKSALNSHASILDFRVPIWGVSDFINERSKWQKQITSATGEPGWFYFKIFFDFRNSEGLFGDIIKDTNQYGNTALKYLLYSYQYYNQEKLLDRLKALVKFVSLLSYINCEAPWFFRSISGLDKANNKIYTKDFGAEKTIEIGCSDDAIDMRLNLLMDLYKYAAFDDINCKEIIPENLRKFNMTVLVFNTPIKYHQTAIKTQGGQSFNYKNFAPYNDISFNGTETSNTVQQNEASASVGKKQESGKGKSKNKKQKKGKNTDASKSTSTTNNTSTTPKSSSSSVTLNYSNSLSYKMFTFHNCEFIDMSTMMPGLLSNERPNSLGKSSIRIKYDRVYNHTMNEWNDMMFGSDGFKYISSTGDLHIEGINTSFNDGVADAMQTKTSSNINYNLERLNELSNALISNSFDPSSDTYKYIVDLSEYLINDALIGNDATLGNLYNYYSSMSDTNNYFKNKMSFLHDGSVSGNIYDYYLGPGSKYYDKKNQKLKKGTIKGNIYDYELGRSGNGDKRQNTEYLNKKNELLHKGIINGNIYDYDLIQSGKLDNRKITKYFKLKLENLHKGGIEGNLYDYDLIRTGSFAKRKNTEYLNMKLSEIKDGGIQYNKDDEGNIISVDRIDDSWIEQYGESKQYKDSTHISGLDDNDKKLYGSKNEFAESNYNGGSQHLSDSDIKQHGVRNEFAENNYENIFELASHTDEAIKKYGTKETYKLNSNKESMMNGGNTNAFDSVVDAVKGFSLNNLFKSMF